MNRFIRQTFACVTLLYWMLWRQLSSNFTEIKRIMNIYKCFLLMGNLEQVFLNVFLACRIPCEQWFLQAGRYVLSVDKPLLAGYMS